MARENELIVKLVTEFADKYVEPRAQEIDETEEFPTDIKDLMGKFGIFAIPFPREVGGAGGTDTDYVDTVRILANHCGTSSVIVSAHVSLCCWPIFNFGTKAQKEKYLPDLLSGKKLGAFGLTEPMAGTDSAAQQTKAIDKGDYYEITGSKIFITNAEEADVYVIFAMTDPELGTRGISAFIMEKGMEGFSFGPAEKKMGIRGSATKELVFDKVKVPKENMLGRANQGFRIAMQTLDGGRIGIAAQALGLAEGAFNRTVEYVKQRKQFGRPIAQFQNTQFKIAEMATQLEAARLLVYKAAKAKETQKVYTQEAAMAKLYASKVAVEITNMAIQLHGGYGYIRDYAVERLARDAKITEIYEGTSEVQKMVIGGGILRWKY